MPLSESCNGDSYNGVESMLSMFGGFMEKNELAQRLVDGDQQCLAMIRSSLGPQTQSKLKQRFGSSLSNEDIEDAISIGLERLWLNRHRFNPELSALSTWFYIIVRNVAIDLIRERRTNNANPPAEAPLAGVRLTDEQTEIVNNYLQSLSEEDRLILRVFAEKEGSDHWAKDAAELLGKSAGAVRVRKLRLIRRIEQLLEEGER